MLFWGVLDPFLDLKGIKIFFFTNIHVYNYFLGQTKPFATSNRDRLDTPKINLNVQCSEFSTLFCSVKKRLKFGQKLSQNSNGQHLYLMHSNQPPTTFRESELKWIVQVEAPSTKVQKLVSYDFKSSLPWLLNY